MFIVNHKMKFYFSKHRASVFPCRRRVWCYLLLTPLLKECAVFQAHRRLQHICILLMFDLKQDQSKRKVSLQVSAQYPTERSRVLGDGEDDEGAAGPA